MLGSLILEIALGLIFVYFLMSLLCTALNELVESFLKHRAKYLFKGIQELLQEPIKTSSDTNEQVPLLELFYKHPLVFSLYKDNFHGKARNLPSYIPSRNFALAFLDIALGGAEASAASLQERIKTVENPHLRQLLNSFLWVSGEDREKLLLQIEAWYDSAMDRVAGWYKRHAQRLNFVLALLLTVLLNANTITIAVRLSTDTPLREALVDQAANREEKDKSIDKLKGELDNTKLPLGWEKVTFHWFDDLGNHLWDRLFLHLFGWALTAIAVTLGAPFWFDLLNKVMVIRSTVKPHEKSPEEPAVDRKREPVLHINVREKMPLDQVR